MYALLVCVVVCVCVCVFPLNSFSLKPMSHLGGDDTSTTRDRYWLSSRADME